MSDGLARVVPLCGSCPDKPADKVSAREWYIAKGPLTDWRAFVKPPKNRTYFRVIEHSAYLAEVEKVRVLSEALEKINS